MGYRDRMGQSSPLTSKLFARRSLRGWLDAIRRPLQVGAAVVLGCVSSSMVWATDYSVTDGNTYAAALNSIAANPTSNDRIILLNSITMNQSVQNISKSVGGSLTVVGNGFTINGGAQYQPFNIQSGSVTLQNVTVQGGQTVGGSGGNGGGGGLGAGGAVFVSNQANLTLSGVTFANNQAVGGSGGLATTGVAAPIFPADGGGGGGGLQNPGGLQSAPNGGTGAGPASGSIASAGAATAGTNGAAGVGIAISTGTGGTTGGAGGGGGGGGGSTSSSGSASSSGGTGGTGGNGGFGGGGGAGGGGGNSFGATGAFVSVGGNGGTGGNGGFGGGGGAGGYNGVGTNGSGSSGAAGTGGYFGGNGASGSLSWNGSNVTVNQGSGGGGAAFGGAVFVETGGKITIIDAGNGGVTFTGNGVTGGSGNGIAGDGSTDGANLFLMRGVTSVFDIGAGQTDTFTDIIGNNDGTATAGVILQKKGAGTLVLNANSQLLSQTTVDQGTLDITALTQPLGGTMTVNNGGTLIGTTTSIVGDVTDDGLVKFTQSTPGTYAGVISGGGAVEIGGTGAITFTGVNTYTGGTTIDNGSTLTGTISSVQGNIFTSQSGVLNFNSTSGTYAGNLTGSGFARIINGSALTFTGTNSGFSGTTFIDATSTLTGTTDSVFGDVINFNQLNLSAGAVNTIFSGGISGSGVVNITSGAVTFAGLNNYSGGTVVSPGATLIGPTGSLQGNILDNGSVIFNNTTAGTYAGILSGTGNVEISGVGPVTFSGANNYSGGTTVDSGATLIGSTTSLQGNILDNGLVTFSQAGAGTYAGVLSGAGAVEIAGVGPITFTGPNTYSGGTTIDNGSTLIGSLSSLQGNFNTSSSGTLNFNGTSGAFGGKLSGSGNVLITGGSNLFFAGQNSGFSGTTTIDTVSSLTGTTDTIYGNIVNNNFVSMSAGSMNTVYSGNVSGTGRMDITAGTVTFTGTDTYTGPTTVEGTLIANGSMTSSVIVNSGGTLMGHGSVGTTTINSGATIQPGTPGSPLTVNGTMTFLSGSTYNAGITPTSADEIVVNGTSSIAASGTTFNLQLTPGAYSPGQVFTVLNTSGGLTGKFAVNNLPLPAADLFFAENYTPTSLEIVVLPTTIGSGSMYANMSAATFQTATAEMQILSNRLALMAGPETGGPVSEARISRRASTKSVSTSKTEAWIRTVSGKDEDETPYNVQAWAQGLGLAGRFGGGFHYSVGGTIFGIDQWWDENTLVGVLGGYSGTNLSQSSTIATGSMNTGLIGVYELYRTESYYLSNIDAYNGQSYNISRQVSITGLPTQSVSGSANSNVWSHYTELGANRPDATAQWLQPFIGLQYLYLGQDGVSESGGSVLGLNTNYEVVNSVRSTTGVRYSNEFQWGNVILIPNASVRYQRELASGAGLLTSSFQGAPGVVYATSATRTGYDFGLGSIGTTAVLSDRHTVYLNVDAQVAGSYRAIIGSAGFQISW